DELAAFQMIELHPVPSSQAGLQDIESAGIRQGVSVSLGKPLNQSVNYALRTSWRRSGPTIIVNDNFLNRFIGHRLDERDETASGHRQLVHAHQRFFGF